MISVTREFREFLVEAKKNTYASDSPVGVSETFLESSRQLQYAKGNYLYKDIYLGSEQFSGIEVVYEDDLPVWTMVYSGGLLYPMDQREIYAFLKKALRNVSPDFPARGPMIFQEGDMVYENSYKGNIEKFSGEEKILMGGVEVYALKYEGGLIR